MDSHMRVDFQQGVLQVTLHCIPSIWERFSPNFASGSAFAISTQPQPPRWKRRLAPPNPRRLMRLYQSMQSPAPAPVAMKEAIASVMAQTSVPGAQPTPALVLGIVAVWLSPRPPTHELGTQTYQSP